jgi:hypothetical protein
MPFIKQQQLSIPPAIMVQRFCSMAAETLSSHAQVTCIPPAHFAKVIVHRGTIIMFMDGAVGAWVPIVPGDPVIGMPVIDIPDRSISLVVAIFAPSIVGPSRGNPSVRSGRRHCDHTPAGFQVIGCEFHRGVHGHPDQLSNH